MITLYGINNCDTVRKAKRWLDDNGVDVAVHDFRNHGLSRKLLLQWLHGIGAAVLLNKRSTSWKQLPEATRVQIQAELENGLPQRGSLLIDTLLLYPTLIKRPILQIPGHKPVVGFSAHQYAALRLQQNA
ncbi:MAG: ArsC/Spx/MgsR family protein [Pseudomonadales bacterium]